MRDEFAPINLDKIMAELNTLSSLLQTIQWSYAALWTLSRIGGWFHLKASGDSSESRNAELFYYLYEQLTFAIGIGFAGHAFESRGDSILWLAGDVALKNVPKPVANQTFFIKAAEIQTVICVPLEDKVLELGTSNLVPEDDEVAHYIKKILYSLLDPYMMKPQFSQSHSPSTFNPVLNTTALRGGSQAGDEPSSLTSQLSSTPVEGLISVLAPVFEDVNASYVLPQATMTTPDAGQNRLSWIPPQVNTPFMDLGLWRSTSALASLLDSHTEMGVLTSMIDHVESRVVPSLNLPVPLMPSNESLLEVEAAAFITNTSSSTAIASVQNASECTTSSSISPILTPSALLEDNEISSVAKVYADCQITDSKIAFDRDPTSSLILPRTRPRLSISPKESSPESSSSASPILRAIPTSVLQQQTQAQTSLTRADLIQNLKLERQTLSSEKVGDATPVLLQVGNVLQLGDASGKLAEAIPVEHDEAAVSHMLAERRRRIKQNENFSQLKALVPNAAKMDKASLLAETIVYINKLKAQLEVVEQSNESLKFLVGDRGEESPGPSSPKARESVEVVYDGEGNLRIQIRSSCPPQDCALQILTTLRKMQLNILNSQMSYDGDRITATFVVKIKRKNPTGQTEVCAHVESELKRCLGFVGTV